MCRQSSLSKNYSYKSFRKDFFAGLTVAAVAVPQAMAYSLIFNLPVEMGLYTAIIMTAVGALLDSSKQLINGPTNVISIAMLSALTLAFGEYSNLTGRTSTRMAKRGGHDGAHDRRNSNRDRVVPLR